MGGSEDSSLGTPRQLLPRGIRKLKAAAMTSEELYSKSAQPRIPGSNIAGPLSGAGSIFKEKAMAEGHPETRLSPTLRARTERFLAAESDALEEFPPREAQKLVLELYAHQMELQLQNAELRQEQVVVQRFLHRQEESRALLEAARAVMENRPFVHTAGAIFDVCKLLIGATSGYVVLLSPDDAENEVLCLEANGRSCKVDPGFPRLIRSLREKSHHASQVIYDNDFPRSARRQKFSPLWQVTPDNVLFAFVMLGGKKMACLVLANKPGGFTENDTHIATAFGELVAITIGNSQSLKALRQSEERFRSMVQTAIDAIISTDGRGRIISWNQGAQTIFGYREEEVIDQPLTILIPERCRAACQRKLDQRRLSGQTPFPGKVMQVQGLRKDGGELPMELSLSRWEASGKIGYTAIIRDISERQALALTLESAANKWRITFDAIGEAVCLMNRNNEILQCNQAMSDLARKPFEEIIGRHCWEVVHNCSSPIDGCPFGRMVKSRQRETIILPRENCWFKVAVDPILEDDGNLSGAVHVITDITSVKQAEEARRREKLFLASIFASIQDGISILDLDLNIVQVNPTMERWYAQAQPLVGKKCYQVFQARGEVCQACPSLRTIATGEPHHETLPKLGGAGEVEGWLEVHVFPWIDPATDNMKGVIVNLQDITHRLQAQEALTDSLAKLKKTLHGTVLALASAAERRDPYTAGHQRKVAQLACAIAREMGLNPEQIEGVRVIGLLHDIGKIAVPAEILTKTGKISESEFSLIKNHPQVGYEILKQVEFPWPVARAVLQHHERLDSSGYPEGLGGSEICLEARIIAVADVVEAMSFNRPYRSSLGIDQALGEILQYKGVRYDPEVVDACMGLFTAKVFNFDQESSRIASHADKTAVNRGDPGPTLKPAARKSRKNPVQSRKSAAEKPVNQKGDNDVAGPEPPR
jgi:PAS domain S-box-containing protein/putative nucleotidyltransferase with HDIG domain